MSILAALVPGFFEILVIAVIYLIAFLIPVVVFWKICSKAGFPGALGLLMLIPFGNIILPLYIAFADWPALQGNQHA